MGQMGVICISYVLDLLVHWPFCHILYAVFILVPIYIYNRGDRVFLQTGLEESSNLICKSDMCPLNM
jgi:hypothetical protein